MAGLPRPLPLPDRDTAPFWEAQADHRLVFQRCSACAAFRYPVGPLCPACRSFDFEWVESAGRGAVYSYTVVRHQTHPAFEAPYTVLLVQMEEGPRLVARLRDPEDARLEIGAAVRLEWEDVPGQPLPVFAIEEGSA
jgi:uncharacterized OB-fold protein